MTATAAPPPDLQSVLARVGDGWREFAGARMFVTGGTGFVGKWLLESFLFANREHALGAELVALSRAPRAFAQALPQLAGDPALKLVEGDVRTFVWPAGRFTHAIHGATDVARAAAPAETFDVAVAGTRRVLDFCRERGVGDLLLVSSGAVYGRQPPELERIAESHAGATPAAGYGEGKRAAEALVAAQGGLRARIARCFAFVGPHLPTDLHFAAGNFIGDALRGEPIRIQGDGTTLRSYLYAADMAAWLWRIMLKGRAGQAYNVGSDQAVSIAELARIVVQAADAELPIRIAQPPAAAAPERYVPDIARARGELGLDVWTPLPEAVARTLQWHRQREAAHA
jgi:dTDP-glucose 4,6-dehydratase